MPGYKFDHKIQTCHNLWLWLLLGDFTPPPECQERYTESPEQVHESSLKVPDPSSYPCMGVRDPTPGARFL